MSVPALIPQKNPFASMTHPADTRLNLYPKAGALCYAYLRAMDPGGWFERDFVNTPDEHPEVATIGQHVFYA
jgi:hypothetical protein